MFGVTSLITARVRDYRGLCPGDRRTRHCPGTPHSTGAARNSRRTSGGGRRFDNQWGAAGIHGEAVS